MGLRASAGSLVGCTTVARLLLPVGSHVPARPIPVGLRCWHPPHPRPPFQLRRARRPLFARPPTGGRTSRPEYAEVFMPEVDLGPSRRFAHALITPPSANPAPLLRHALEAKAGNPVVELAPSYYGAMMVIFSSENEREATMHFFPLTFNDSDIDLERPEHGPNRFGWQYEYFAELSAGGFPLEHWTEAGIRTAFRSIGNVCCIHPHCLSGSDFSAVRFIIKLEHIADVPFGLLVRNFSGDEAADVPLRVIRSWTTDEDASSHSFSDSLRGPPSSSHPPRCSMGGLQLDPLVGPEAMSGRRLDDIGMDSLHGEPSFPGGMDQLSGYCPYSQASIDWIARLIARRIRASSARPVPPPVQEQPPAPVAAAAQEKADVLPLCLDPEAVHDDVARKQRVRDRRSACLAAKEPAQYVPMVTRAASLKARKFGFSKASASLKNIIHEARLEDVPRQPMPLAVLQGLAEPCGVTPADLAGAVTTLEA